MPSVLISGFRIWSGRKGGKLGNLEGNTQQSSAKLSRFSFKKEKVGPKNLWLSLQVREGPVLKPLVVLLFNLWHKDCS